MARRVSVRPHAVSASAAACAVCTSATAPSRPCRCRAASLSEHPPSARSGSALALPAQGGAQLNEHPPPARSGSALAPPVQGGAHLCVMASCAASRHTRGSVAAQQCTASACTPASSTPIFSTPQLVMRSTPQLVLLSTPRLMVRSATATPGIGSQTCAARRQRRRSQAQVRVRASSCAGGGARPATLATRPRYRTIAPGVSACMASVSTGGDAPDAACRRSSAAGSSDSSTIGVCRTEAAS